MASVNRMKPGVISAGKEIGTFGLRAEHNSKIIGPDRLNTPVAEEAPFLTCGCLRALLPPLKKALPSGRVGRAVLGLVQPSVLQKLWK